MTGSILKKVLFPLFLLLVLFIVFQPVYLFHKSGYEAPNGDASRVLDASYSVLKDGLVVSQSLPFYSFYFNGSSYTLSFPLGHVEDGEALAFLTRGTGLRVLIDGDEIYSYVYPERYSYPSVRMYHSVPLCSEYSGSSVLVEYVKGRSTPILMEISAPVLGGTSSNYHYFFDPYEWPSILLISMFFLGILLLLLSFLLKGEKRRGFLIFSLLVIDITLTIFFESLLSEILISNPLFSSLSSVFLRALAPYIFILFLRNNFPSMKAFSPYSLLSTLSISIALLFPLFSTLSFFSLADFNMIYLILEPFSILFLSIAVTVISRLKGRKAFIYTAISSILLLKNFLRIILSAFFSSGILFDVLNIILSSFVFIVCIFDALRMYAEENEMIVNINSILERSHIDSLSGLENVSSFKTFITRLEDEGKTSYVMLFDIDGLKRVNDSLGHMKGDELIRDFGRAVKNMGVEKYAAFRVGGDEFVVFIPGAEKRPDVLSGIVRGYEEMDDGYSVSGCGSLLESFERDLIIAFFKKLDAEVLRIKREKNENR